MDSSWSSVENPDHSSVSFIFYPRRTPRPKATSTTPNPGNKVSAGSWLPALLRRGSSLPGAHVHVFYHASAGYRLPWSTPPLPSSCVCGKRLAVVSSYLQFSGLNLTGHTFPRENWPFRHRPAASAGLTIAFATSKVVVEQNTLTVRPRVDASLPSLPFALSSPCCLLSQAWVHAS